MSVHPPNLDKSCSLILNSVRNSSLNFSVHETPYSLYLTVRKSFAKNRISQDDQKHLQVANKTISETLEQEEILMLRNKLSESESMNAKLKHEIEEVVNDSDEKYLQLQNLEIKVLNYKETTTKLESERDDAEKHWKVLNKQVKEKDKQIYDLKKENCNTLESLSQFKTKFSNLTAEVNKEKKKQEKKLKKQGAKDSVDSLNVNEHTFECTMCDVKMVSVGKLCNHMRVFHMKSSSVQTDEIVLEEKKVQTYNTTITSDKNIQTAEEIVISKVIYIKHSCFYCDTEIISEQHLLEHRLTCHVSTKTFSVAKGKSPPPNVSSSPLPVSFSLPVGFPPPNLNHHLQYYKPSWSHLSKCVTCGWIATSGTDLMNHMKSVHNEKRSPFEIYK